MASNWLKLEPTRHQIAIAGNVTDAQTGAAIGRARAEITAAPAAFTDWLAIHAKQHRDRWAAMDERPDRTHTAVDGHFHFLDLPDGDYTLTASLPGSGTRYGTAQAAATVSRDAQGNITMATADIALPPTTVKGQITNQDGAPVVMAEVRVKGSGERGFSDAQGEYRLTGLEATKERERTVLVSARGYQPASETVLLSEAGTEQTLDFVLFSTLTTSFAFGPTLFAGCKLWLEAEAITGLSDNSPVSTWPDSSGNDHHATQTTVARQPTFRTHVFNGKPAVSFDGQDDFMSLSLSETSTNHTFFFVYDLEALGRHNNFLSDAENGRLTLDSAGRNSPHYVRWQDSAWHDIAAAVAGQQILTWVFSGTRGEVFRNGTSLGTSTYDPVSLGGRIALGSYYTGAQSRFEGDMVAVIYYNRALLTVDRRRVEQYLSHRYAIPLA